MDNINISIFGSTGSIGSFVLSLIDKLEDKDKPEVFLLSGYNQIKKLIDLEEKYKAKYLYLPENYKEQVFKSLPLNLRQKIDIISSFDELYEIYKQVDKKNHFILNGIIGINGIIPTFLSQHFKIFSGCANKESIIISYELFKDFNSDLVFPLDSEHNAIYELLPSCPKEKIEKIFITGSGGKVFGKKEEEIEDLSLDEMVKHPNWNMGKRITIDSSSGINKAFEFIEVQALFDIPKDKINILIDSKSQIHAIIQDSSNYYYVAASHPDMLLPINKFLNKIGINTSYKSSQILNKSIKFELNNEIEKTYPFLSHFMNNYKKEFIHGTVIIFLNSYFQDLLFSKKINFFRLRKLLIDSYNILFSNNKNPILRKLKENSNRFSFLIKNDFMDFADFTDSIFKDILNYLHEKNLLEEQW
jgi:1-deoxy-D-xylulose-5-phosphate reductoisomerase